MYRLNRYSIALIFVYLLAIVVMEYGTSSHWSEGLIKTGPLILAMVIWSEILTTRLTYKTPVSIADSFHRDFFIINYATLFAFIASLLGEYNNIDAKGWWTFLIIVAELYGMIIGFVSASCALLLDRQHFRYTLIFALILFINFSTLKLMPASVHTIALGNIGIFPLCTIILLSVHAIICLSYRFSKYNLLPK